MRILAIGQGAEQVALQLYPAATIDTTDLKPGSKQTGYDALVVYHALNRVPYAAADKMLHVWVEALKKGGDLQIFVPSLEWAAEEILSDKPSKALVFHLFGVNNEYKSGYTMKTLRNMMASAGLSITHARAGSYFIGEEECEMHLVLGKRE